MPVPWHRSLDDRLVRQREPSRAGRGVVTTELTSAVGASSRRLAVFAVPWPVLLVAALMLAGLLAVSGQYGFHGDEMYYVVAGQHPAFGYVDQPPLTPLLSAASVALLGVTPTAVRVLPALEMALIVVLIALMARDLAGRAGRRSSPRSQPPSPAISAPVTSTPPPIPTCWPGRSSCGCW